MYLLILNDLTLLKWRQFLRLPMTNVLTLSLFFIIHCFDVSHRQTRKKCSCFGVSFCCLVLSAVKNTSENRCTTHFQRAVARAIQHVGSVLQRFSDVFFNFAVNTTNSSNTQVKIKVTTHQIILDTSDVSSLFKHVTSTFLINTSTCSNNMETTRQVFSSAGFKSLLQFLVD